jgi:hypothetical protein
VLAHRVGILLSGVVLAVSAHGQPTPSSAELDDLLQSMHRYAAQYVTNLPNFLCVQVTRQLEAGVKSEHWHKGDTLIYKLSFNHGSERRSLDLVNGKPADPTKRHWRTPLVTEGEFGLLLSRVLGPRGEAWFTWRGWETLRGKRVAVFDYSVDKEHSSLSLSLGDLVKAFVPYHGSVFADPATGAVWRITDAATEIPLSLMTREISTTIDYNDTSIGDKSYLLPVEAVVLLLLDRKKVRNEIEFQDYRKFEADSSITFGTVE